MQKEIKRCPIQIIDEPTRFKGARWIALLKDINFEAKLYLNIVHFHKGFLQGASCYDRLWINKLFKGRNSAEIAPDDIIRNPTIEELNQIKDILKQNGFKLNFKTLELIDLTPRQ